MSATAVTDRDTVASKLGGFSDDDKAFLALMLENPKQDETFAEGLFAYLEQSAGQRFLNSLKLERCGEWLGNSCPARMQIRLMEIAKSSQHGAYLAFRQGLTRSGGLERAYPKSAL
ncbi:hypothetical protein GOZ89_09115 [Agrobacterium vitis]|nr:hypothetical protein [Agrobacterium vitis]MCE6073553.1 hypothetical protein [Agrobacterium vitis]MUO69043.1 hypothetical protein [Agrobacterium vitis]MUO83593.1 hypothetical protein [Agrobacterium vitis]MVA33805.1 hypothetical protein [Agrobacterium vitis]MVA79576.1 hypothetical protein [Agrobacterium vitis]